MKSVLFLALMAIMLCQEGTLGQLLDDQCESQEEFGITFSRPAGISWMASLYDKTEFVCGGSLITKRFVLTAAHCIQNQTLEYVNLGEYDRSCSRWKCREVDQYNISLAIVHMQFSFVHKKYDIGLVKLDREVLFNAHVRPICIIMDDSISSGAVNEYSVYGWGKLSADGPTSNVLQFIQLTHRNNCKIRVPSPDTQICAGSSSGDTCRGDSGSPLASYFYYQGIKRFVQFGLVSHGSQFCDNDGIYTNVLAFKRWIAGAISYSA